MATALSDRITIDDIRGRATITPDEVASLFDLDPDSVLKALRLGELPGFRVGRLWRVPVPKLLALLDVESDRMAA